MSYSYCNLNGSGSAIAGATSVTYAPPAAGTYTQMLTADGTCSTAGTTSSGSWVVGDYVNYTYIFETSLGSWNESSIGHGTDFNNLWRFSNFSCK